VSVEVPTFTTIVLPIALSSPQHAQEQSQHAVIG
jgi:hypothetical protein